VPSVFTVYKIDCAFQISVVMGRTRSARYVTKYPFSTMLLRILLFRLGLNLGGLSPVVD